MKIIAFIVTAVVLVFFPNYIYSQNAAEIIKKAEDKMRSGTIYAEITITTIRPKWSRVMEMKSWAKGTDFSVILITSPAKEKGTVFLKRYKEAWNWLPSIERTIKLPPSMMSQSWMGTDFTNDDLVQESSNEKDYTHKIAKDTVINGHKCWKLKLTPKEDAAVVWGKVYIYIDKVNYIQLKTEMYDEDGYLVNTLMAYEIKKMGGKIIATKMKMIPADKKGHRTLMEYKDLKFEEAISDNFFTVQNMKRLK
jgi:outer membrane lipoprotein-sorting protein